LRSLHSRDLAGSASELWKLAKSAALSDALKAAYPKARQGLALSLAARSASAKQE